MVALLNLVALADTRRWWITYGRVRSIDFADLVDALVDAARTTVAAWSALDPVAPGSSFRELVVRPDSERLPVGRVLVGMVGAAGPGVPSGVDEALVIWAVSWSSRPDLGRGWE